jgi:hypothetical protein
LTIGVSFVYFDDGSKKCATEEEEEEKKKERKSSNAKSEKGIVVFVKEYFSRKRINNIDSRTILVKIRKLNY